MFRTIGLVVLLVAWTQAAQADIVVDYVDGGGREWADLNGSKGFSRNEIATVCAQDGQTACVGSLGGVDFTGWIWATRDQVREVVREITGLTTELDDFLHYEEDSAWAPTALSVLTPTREMFGIRLVEGWTSSLLVISPTSTYGRIHMISDSPAGQGDQVRESIGVVNFPDSDLGVWLFKPSIDGLFSNLIGLVIGFNLQAGISNSFDAKLSVALSALDDVNQNNDVAAVNALNAFINAVEANRGREVTSSQADQLILGAQAIISRLVD